jgi:hypothetical protein
LRILKSYRGKGVHPGQPLPIFEVEPIRSGQRSLLSIGEGGSSFVGHLLELRRAMLGPSEDHPLIDTLLAVDPAYFKDAPTRYPFLLSRLNRRELSQAQRFFKEFPENYTGGLAQDGGFHLI